MTIEGNRLRDAYQSGVPWRRWGPYLSERQWGTVREDYGEDGESWAYFPHEQSRSRAYRWGEDGLLGLSDEQQLMCFCLAMWNGQDPILKERVFGLTNDEGNHGEDCKDYYYYLDSTPTHSYMKALYKYPQRAFPYDELIEANRGRSREDLEYELVDTGVFDDGRYFDVLVEYAKGSPEDVLIQISISNRGPDPAPLRLLPTLWFRNTWSWSEDAPRPKLETRPGSDGISVVATTHPELGQSLLFCEGAPALRFTENETNNQLLFGGENTSLYIKDGINDFVVRSRVDAVNPEGFGTKVAADYGLTIGPDETRVVRLRLVQGTSFEGDPFGQDFDDVLGARQAEADEFYQSIMPESGTADEWAVMRQALAGMLWSKQYYHLDQDAWLAGRDNASRRNPNWSHLRAHDIISMPDKWEYPWFAVWDLAFHALALMLVDVDFAKLQLSMFLEDRYLRADGAIPAYEWNFSDVNPPVHAYATLRVYQFEKAKRNGTGDIEFLRWMYERLSRNFDWWVQRKSVDGEDVFQGGFLGLDNIGVFDRSSGLPTGGHLEQSDGTAWMVFYAQTMLSMSLELCRHDPSYEERALYFLDQVLTIASAVDKVGNQADELWDEEDGFFYDVLRFPDGSATRLKVRSLVGLLPLAAVAVFEEKTLANLPRLRERLQEVACQDTHAIHCPGQLGFAGRRMLAILDEKKLRQILSRMLDVNEFLSPHGVRSMSRYHLDNPYVFHWEGQEHVVGYLPAESDSGMFGGNSNWRGPIWMPPNYLLLRALLQLYSFYGDTFKIECPTGSGQEHTLFEIALDLGKRITGIFLTDDEGRRPVFGGTELFQKDPHWRDNLLFFEYFHGENGAGVGASHQTGWTGLVATIMSTLGRLDANDFKMADEQALAKMLAGTDGKARQD